MAKLILVLWVVQRVSTSGDQRCAAPREVGGTNDVTVSNRVNLVDPLPEWGLPRAAITRLVPLALSELDGVPVSALPRITNGRLFKEEASSDKAACEVSR